MSTNVWTVVKFVVPGLGTALLAPLLDATDAAIVGRFASVTDLASLSPAVASFDILGLCFLFLSTATIQQLSVARGNKNYASARSKLADMCCFTIVCGLAISCFMLRNHHRMLGMLTSPETLAAVAAPAAAYMHIRAVAFPVQLLQLVLSAACCSALQDTITPLCATAVGGAVNLMLDMFLIAGLGLGTAGAAAATASGQLVAVLMLTRALRSQQGFEPAIQYGLPLLPNPLSWFRSLRLARMLPLIAFAAPFMFFQFMQVLLLTLETRMGSEFGAMSLAAHQITVALWKPLFFLGDPIMQAGSSLVPAQKDKDRIRGLAQAILLVAAGLGVASGALGYVLFRYMPFVFTANVAVAKEAAGLALPAMLSIMACSIWSCNQGLMLGTGRARLLAILYSWNVLYFFAGSSIVLTCKLALYHSWCVFASMHGIFALIVNIVLRLPTGVFSRARMAQRDL
jgi:Na+-driven multidrug efflux pump